MEQLQQLREAFLNHLQDRVDHQHPKSLYDPVHYILGLGGKRLRPLLTLMSARMYGVDVAKAMDAALAVEVFHNFSLLHDDIMDDADLRRGKDTVHVKWDVNTGILSGDAMLIMAYQYLESYESAIAYDLFRVFSKTALEVCEGQQYDVDFETRNDVTIPEYIEMIRLKTSVLLGCALQMGAVIAGVDIQEQQKIYNYGIELGIAFQLMDDYLDAFGDPATFGKEVGGDIRENKKTYLYLKSLEHPDYKKELEHWFSMDYITMTDQQILDKKQAVKELFVTSGGADKTLQAIKDYTQKALTSIASLSVPDQSKTALIDFSNYLMNRVQ